MMKSPRLRKIAKPARMKSPRSKGDMQLNFNSLPSLLGFHVRLANTAMIRDFMETLRDLAMTQRQGAILMLIGANPGAPQMALADLLSTDRATMMAMVDRLEHRGLLERRASTGDRRIRDLHLTSKGQKMLVNLKRKIAKHEKHFIGRFSKAELQTFLDFLVRVHQKL